LKERLRSSSSLFEHLFLRYGAGSEVFKPVTRNRFWNRICWTLIVLGIIGWIFGLWFLRRFSDFSE
jgi:hypothetical protein